MAHCARPAAARLPSAVRVLLVNPNRYEQPYPVYPLGLAYLRGALESAGHAARIWDAASDAASLAETVREFAPHLVGVSMRNIDNVQIHQPRSFVAEVADCCTAIRALTPAPLVLGGSGFSIFPRELFELTGVDYGIAGAGELPLLRLIASLQTGATLDGISGLLWRSDSGVQVCAAHRTTVAFPSTPAHEPALLQAYARRGSLPGIQTQRGCPLRCCYCTYPLIEGRRSRFREPADVVAEMRRMTEHGVHYTFIVDSVFNTQADHVAAICEALIRAGLDMHWECFLRPHRLDRALLQLMKRAGLRHIEFGSDSLADPVLKSYGKSFGFEDIRLASENAHALGLHYSHFLILGGPGETPATLEETLTRAGTLPGACYFATIGMRIYPGTGLWRTVGPEANGETVADYLPVPRFHLARGFTAEGLHARLREVRRTQPNWVIGDPPAAFDATLQKLRARGLRGPLWEYIEVLQRLNPADPAASDATRPAIPVIDPGVEAIN